MQNYKVSYLLQKLQMLCGTSLHCTVGSHCRDQSKIKYTFGVPLVFTASGRMATECPAFMKQVALRRDMLIGGKMIMLLMAAAAN